MKNENLTPQPTETPKAKPRKKETTAAGKVGDWQRLLAPLVANADELKHLEIPRAKLAAMVAQAADLKQQQAAQRAAKQAAWRARHAPAFFPPRGLDRRGSWLIVPRRRLVATGPRLVAAGHGLKSPGRCFVVAGLSLIVPGQRFPVPGLRPVVAGLSLVVPGQRSRTLENDPNRGTKTRCPRDNEPKSLDYDPRSGDHDSLSRGYDSSSRDHETLSRDHESDSLDNASWSRDRDSDTRKNRLNPWISTVLIGSMSRCPGTMTQSPGTTDHPLHAADDPLPSPRQGSGCIVPPSGPSPARPAGASGGVRERRT